MDRLEAFLDAEIASWDEASREAVMVAGLLVAVLLFADDLALVARSMRVLQRLLDALAAFCASASLTVNV